MKDNNSCSHASQPSLHSRESESEQSMLQQSASEGDAAAAELPPRRTTGSVTEAQANAAASAVASALGSGLPKPADISKGSQQQQQGGAGATTDRRSMFERHWSTSNLSSNGSGSFLVRGTNGRQQSTPNEVASSTATASYVDIAALTASWANTDGANMFGSVAGTEPFQSTPTFNPIESSSFSMSSMSAVAKVDPSSAIHDAARITDWDKVLDLCASHPEYAKYSNNDGWTALHHVCSKRCPLPHVAEALIEANPKALLAEEDKGWLPLHYACRFKTPKDVVKLLLYQRPEMGRIAVSKKDRLGRTPLYYAVRYDAPPGVVGLLLEVNPAAVLEEDQNDESPLALVWNTWADKLDGKRTIRSFLTGGFPEPEGVTEQERTKLLWDQLRRQPKIWTKWEKVNMLLKAAFGFPVEDEDQEHDTASIGSERTWRILHATSAIKCHLSLFLMATALHPEQAQELDESDLRRPSDPMLSGESTHQTALHLAAASNAKGEAGKTVIQNLLDLHRNAAHVQDAVDGSLPLHIIVGNPHKQDWPNFGSLLCHVYPRALQIPDHNGKLPLHRAASAIVQSNEAGEDYTRTSVIMNVVRLFPQAASHLDNSGCLPFHILAMNAGIWDENVESVYNAHRAAAQARTGASLDNRLAVHLAASNPAAQESLITRLVRLHPRGVSVPDRSGKLPFHLACEIGKEWENGLSVIYEAFPGAIEQAEDNSRAWFPLHMAASCSESSAGLIKKLAELNPAAASVRDHNGRYPLHLACAAGKKWDSGVETLFNACPYSLASTDNAGNLPFHVAALHYCHRAAAAEAAKAAARELEEGEEEAGDQADCDATENSQEETETALNELENLYQLLRADPSVI